MRVAFFTDSYLQFNGVAMTSKRLENFALRNEHPFLCIYAGNETKQNQIGTVTHQELKHSSLSISMDADLMHDPIFLRHYPLMYRALREFRPDVIHVTGLNDVSILGVILARRLKIPILASWHTNIHEYGSRRLNHNFSFVPDSIRKPVTNFLERQILRGAVLYYRMGRVLLAPNQELVEILSKGTKRPSYLMVRGVDTELFTPNKRTVHDGIYRLGFCGRLQPEKNVRMLVDIEKGLLKAGKTNFKFLIVGDGNERAWLEQNLQNAEFTGFISGEKLAEAYANMDIFVFPSETETFGNVIQEANAAGVATIVANVGGPKYIVQHGITGFVAENLDDFVRYTLELITDEKRLAVMRNEARNFALSRSWDSVFERVYQAYAECGTIKPPIPKSNLTVAPLS
ncbi:MAG: glycosyltransferase [Pyrinomonadaceae bacterium]|nr:glycosyltransferase [Pyrinomonadaceae bacterium]